MQVDQCGMEHLGACLDKNSLEELKCPRRDCPTGLISESHMREITPNNNDVYNRYLAVGFNECLNKMGQVKHCQTPNCGFRYIPFDEHMPDSIVCRSCGHRYCSHCQIDHDVARNSCEQARIERERETNPDLAAQADLEWIAQNTKQCIQCGNAVERNAGCNHMTCKCSYEFCYVCGKPWGDLRTCGYFNHQ